MVEIIETTLGKEFEVVMGQSPPSKFYNKSGKGLPFFQGKKEFGKKYPEVQIWSEEGSKIVEKGDVLLSVRAPIGAVNIAPCKCIIGRGLAAIKPNKNTPSELIFYLLKLNEQKLNEKGTGTTFTAISKSNLLSIPIKIPKSKIERYELNKELEYRFSIFDDIEKTINKSFTKLKLLKKSTLKFGFEGKINKLLKK